MKALYNFLHPIHQWAVKILGGIAAFFLALLVFDVLLGVFTRFVMGHQTRWTEEVAINLLVWVSFLGAAVAYAESAHLGVDYVVEKFHPSVRALGQRIVHLIVIAFALYGMVYGGWNLMQATTNVTAALGFPQKWIYAVLPISGLFIVLFALHDLVAPTAEERAPAPTEAIPTDI